MSATPTLSEVVRHLRFQIAEAKRLRESEVAERYLEECAVNATMTAVIHTPGVGAIPSETMLKALRLVGKRD